MRETLVYPMPPRGNTADMEHTVAPHLRSKSNSVAPGVNRYTGTAFEPAPDGWAARIGASLPTRRPLLDGSLAAFFGYIVMSCILLALGYLVMHVIVGGSIGAWDNGVERWLAARRTPTLNTVSSIGSGIGGTLGIVAVALVATIGLGLARWWRGVGFLVAGLVIEATAFLTSSILTNRPRPHVPHLDTLPPTGSFPSGHTAAAVVLYAGLAIFIMTLTKATGPRIFAWLIAVLMPIFVGFSRMYRGMHHPTDVIGGFVLGIGALLFALLAVRIAGVSRSRSAGTSSGNQAAASDHAAPAVAVPR